MAGKKDLDYYLAMSRRIAEHREAGAEREIRKIYSQLLKELKAYIADVHAKYASSDGTLSFADLQKAGYDARFLEEIEKRINVASPKAAKELRQLVNDTYKLAYESMVQGVTAQGVADIDDTFAEAVSITPSQIKKVVNNPLMDVALEKNHKDIIYDIKQAVAVGLMNGDRYTTVARRLTDLLNADKGAYKRAVRIARTETHRVQEAGNHDAALKVDEELQKGTTGRRMCKTWRTMKDERVRPQRVRRKKKGWSRTMGKGPNHIKLDKQTVLENEPFDLLDGNTAMMPGSSGVAGHDINCRCYTSRKMLTDAEYYSKSGKHFPDWKDSDPIAAKYGRVTEYHSIDDDIGTRSAPTCNPNYGKGGAYTVNCQRCVQTYEFRRRGYNVQAKPKPSKNNTVHWGSECFADAVGNAVKYVYKQTAAQVKKIINSAPDGARFGVYVKWKGRRKSAHVFIAEKEGGVVRYVDPQNGNLDVAYYFDIGSAGRFGYFRMDDKEITDDISIIDATMEAKAK